MLKLLVIGIVIILGVSFANKIIGAFLHSPNKAGWFITLLILALAVIVVKNKNKGGNHE